MEDLLFLFKIVTELKIVMEIIHDRDIAQVAVECLNEKSNGVILVYDKENYLIGYIISTYNDRENEIGVTWHMIKSLYLKDSVCSSSSLKSLIDDILDYEGECRFEYLPIYYDVYE